MLQTFKDARRKISAGSQEKTQQKYRVDDERSTDRSRSKKKEKKLSRSKSCAHPPNLATLEYDSFSVPSSPTSSPSHPFLPSVIDSPSLFSSYNHSTPVGLDQISLQTESAEPLSLAYASAKITVIPPHDDLRRHKPSPAQKVIQRAKHMQVSPETRRKHRHSTGSFKGFKPPFEDTEVKIKPPCFVVSRLIPDIWSGKEIEFQVRNVGLKISKRYRHFRQHW